VRYPRVYGHQHTWVSMRNIRRTYAAQHTYAAYNVKVI
jgi:hypothetical protein